MRRINTEIDVDVSNAIFEAIPLLERAVLVTEEGVLAKDALSALQDKMKTNDWMVVADYEEDVDILQQAYFQD